MKKLILALAAFAVTSVSIGYAAQVQRRYVASGQQVYVIDGFTSALSPALSMPNYPDVKAHRVAGVSLAFASEVTTTVTVGYVRGSYTNTIYSEAGTGTTFSWENNQTGSWVLMPSDTFFCTSSDSTEAQLTVILDD